MLVSTPKSMGGGYGVGFDMESMMAYNPDLHKWVWCNVRFNHTDFLFKWIVSLWCVHHRYTVWPLSSVDHFVWCLSASAVLLNPLWLLSRIKLLFSLAVFSDTNSDNLHSITAELVNCWAIATLISEFFHVKFSTCDVVNIRSIIFQFSLRVSLVPLQVGGYKDR